MRIWSMQKTGVALAWLLWLPCVAQQAQEVPAAPAPAITGPLTPGQASPAPPPAPSGAGQVAGGAFGAPLRDEQLSRMRGGSDIPWSEMKLNGTVTGNSAVDVVSGNNAIAGGSFANASGLPMVIQNSGSNVLIQNATIVNVQFK